MIPAHTGQLAAIQFSPLGNRVATASDKGKGVFFYETRQKNLKSTLAGKLNLNWPYSPALPQRPKFKYNFPAKVD